MKNEKKFWVQNLKWATAHLSRRLGAGQAQGARGACVGSAGARWARGGRHDRRAWALGVARRQACMGARAGTGRRQQRARGRARQLGAGAGGRQGAGRAAGRWARGRQGTGRAAGRRWVRGARAAWAPGLALGSALGALGPFSIRFDSFFFFPESPNEHRSL